VGTLKPVADAVEWLHYYTRCLWLQQCMLLRLSLWHGVVTRCSRRAGVPNMTPECDQS